MALYQSKPQQVEAIHWTGANVEAVVAFAEGKVRPAADGSVQLLAGADGAQDWVPVPVGHWLVHPPGDLSDVWPVAPDYFAAKYDACGLPESPR